MYTDAVSNSRGNDSTTAIVSAAEAGCEEAWRELVTRYGRVVTSGVRRVRGLSLEDYDDAIATTWLRLVDDIHRIRKPEAVAGWLRTTAYREALRVAVARRRVVEAEIELHPEAVGFEPDLADDLACDEIRRTILKAMNELSPTGRRLLAALLDDPDASYKEIQERYGIGVSSIGPIRGRVLRSVEGALNEVGVTVPRSVAVG